MKNVIVGATVGAIVAFLWAFGPVSIGDGSWVIPKLLWLIVGATIGGTRGAFLNMRRTLNELTCRLDAMEGKPTSSIKAHG